MTETKKLFRFFILSTVWVLFVTLTLAGIVTAAERTEYINSGKEIKTITSNNLSHQR